MRRRRSPGRHQPVQVVYELIVTIADRYAGKGGDYSHDIPRAEVQKYIDAAHEHDALLLLDIQPGRANFLDVRQALGVGAQGPLRRRSPSTPSGGWASTACPAPRIGSVDAVRGQPGLGLAA